MRRPRTGFTLIEAIVALVILATAMPAMLWAIQGAQLTRNTPVMVNRARWLAQETLESIIADRHAPLLGYAQVIGSAYPPEAQVPGFPQFSRSVTITETGPQFAVGGTGLKTVTVRVGWTDTRGQSREIRLATVLTDYTP